MRTAVVVGAGVGGLATAGALARTGWQVTLLERGDRLRGGGAAVLLWPNGVPALRALGPRRGSGRDRLRRCGRGGLRRPDGRWLVRRAPRGPGADAVVVHADDLHDIADGRAGESVEIRTGGDVRSTGTGGERPGGRATAAHLSRPT